MNPFTWIVRRFFLPQRKDTRCIWRGGTRLRHRYESVKTGGAVCVRCGRKNPKWKPWQEPEVAP